MKSDYTCLALDRKAERLASANVNLAELSLPAKLLWLDGIKTYINRLLRKTTLQKNGCLEWNAAKDWNGYGSTYMFGTQWRAARLFYFLFRGPIPDGAMILHSCDNPCCVNPDHLSVGTAKDNMQDCVRKGRALGPRGEMNGQHKLKAEDVFAIRKRYKWKDREGNNIYAIAKDYGVHPVTVHNIISRKAWKSTTTQPKENE